MKAQLIKKFWCLAIVTMFSFGPLISKTLACCQGDYYVCDSWGDDVDSDIDDNCDGCFIGSIVWLDC